MPCLFRRFDVSEFYVYYIVPCLCRRFDVSEFQPEEVTVKVQDNKLIVNAKHEEKTAQTSVSREYSRQVRSP